MYARIRPLLFRFDPEKTHAITLRLLQLAGALPPVAAMLRGSLSTSSKSVDLIGLRFSNVLGVAAGYDKDGLAWRGLASLGFGHIEIGSVTPKAQQGNPRPRLFRLTEDQALINRLGFPSRGPHFVVKRLQKPRSHGLIIGVNLGINRTAPIEAAIDDYLHLMQKFSSSADYMVVNFSSPNTPGLRNLQTGKHLDDLLREIAHKKTKPLLVKLSPDLGEKDLEETIGRLIEFKIDGIVATNTTILRPQLKANFGNETGGLSGAPLTERSRKIVARIHSISKGKLPIIAAGGIMSADDAMASLDAGASLVQIFTGLIYKGPALIKEILQSPSIRS